MAAQPRSSRAHKPPERPPVLQQPPELQRRTRVSTPVFSPLASNTRHRPAGTVIKCPDTPSLPVPIAAIRLQKLRSVCTPLKSAFSSALHGRAAVLAPLAAPRRRCLPGRFHPDAPSPGDALAPAHGRAGVWLCRRCPVLCLQPLLQQTRHLN